MIEGDGLPSQVCLQCVHYITRAFSFKQLCERSDSTLRQLLGSPLQTFHELKPCGEEISIGIDEQKAADNILNTINSNIEVNETKLLDLDQTEHLPG